MTPGEVNFNGYVAALGGLTYDNKPIPAWSELSDNVRNGWEFGAEEVRQQLRKELRVIARNVLDKVKILKSDTYHNMGAVEKE